MPDERKARERSFHEARWSKGRGERIRLFVDRIQTQVRRDYKQAVARQSALPLLEIGTGVHGIPDGATGIDISEVAVRRGKSLSKPGARFALMDAESLGFRDHSFGVIYGSGVLHHVKLEMALSELKRVLKPGGSAIFLEPLGHNPFINLFRKLTPSMRSVDEHPLTHVDLDEMERHFDCDVRYYLLTGVVAMPFGSGRLLAALQTFDQWLFRKIPWVCSYAWQVLIELKPR